jgi:hypothetical protein
VRGRDEEQRCDGYEHAIASWESRTAQQVRERAESPCGEKEIQHPEKCE